MIDGKQLKKDISWNGLLIVLFKYFKISHTNQVRNYSSLLKLLKDACSQIPTSYSNHLIYYTLMGLKAEGSCQSISLIKSDYSNYINSKNKTLPSYFSKIMLCIKYKFRISNTISYYSIFLWYCVCLKKIDSNSGNQLKT